MWCVNTILDVLKLDGWEDPGRYAGEVELQETLAGIAALVQDGSDMIESSAEDIEASLRAIASLDVEGLNESIRALEAVTTAMGRLFGYQSEN